FSTLPAEPGLAIPAEPGGGVEQVRTVDPHDARFDLRRNVEREVDVLRPDARRESVRRIVGELDRFGGGTERHRDEHGAEDLDLGDRGRRRDGRGQRGRVYVSLRV